ncbi:MAG: vWA domain-containing protein [Leadbetterella sp.]
MNWFSLKWFLPQTFQSFEWGNLLLLWLLLFVPIMFFLKWVFRANSRNIVSLSIGSLKKNISYFSWLRHLIPFFFTLGVICVILAIARPQLEDEESDNYAKGIDIVLGIDISDSMLEQDLRPNRLEAAKRIAIDFLKNQKQDRIALVAFAGEATTISPLTMDYEQLIQYIDGLNPSIIKTSGTALGQALGSCINKLRDVPGKSKVAILISDGDNTVGSIGPETATELAKTFGIRVYTIAIGQNIGTEHADFPMLKSIATGTQGQFFKATDSKILKGIFEKISTLEKTRFEFIGQKDVIDYYYVYLNWAIVFFLTSLFLSKSFFGNILED